MTFPLILLILQVFYLFFNSSLSYTEFPVLCQLYLGTFAKHFLWDWWNKGDISLVFCCQQTVRDNRMAYDGGGNVQGEIEGRNQSMKAPKGMEKGVVNTYYAFAF